MLLKLYDKDNNCTIIDNIIRFEVSETTQEVSETKSKSKKSQSKPKNQQSVSKKQNKKKEEEVCQLELQLEEPDKSKVETIAVGQKHYFTDCDGIYEWEWTDGICYPTGRRLIKQNEVITVNSDDL